ncbi:MAG: heme biosynthesis HemY N-terminal domain-containing protein [Pseudomonadota bacterium]|jgi:HemY protein
MRRGLVLFILLLALAGAAVWLAERPGTVTFVWEDWRLDTSVAFLALVVLALGLVLWLLGRAWGWLRHGHVMSPARRAARRSARGLKDLDGALVALASGDAKQALRLADSAIKRLGASAMAHVVAAQAAIQAGDAARADRHFKELAASAQGRFIGLRGQIQAARQAGETARARALAGEATAAAPKSRWAALTLFEMTAQEGDWASAEAMLKKLVALGAITPETAARHRAALHYGQAVAAERAGQGAQALQFALKAHKADTAFAPATVLAARLLKNAGRASRAAKLIERSWRGIPHPSLAEAYATLTPTETAEARLKRFERLAALNPDHPESRIRLAEAALGASAPEKAREALAPLLRGQVRARVARLMLAVEEAREGAAADKAHWADLATSGVGEPAWRCASCGSERARWLPHCANCGAFNSLAWNQGESPPAQVDMDETLPMIAGLAPSATGRAGRRREEV